MDSILTSVKKMLGIEADYTHFDPDIILHINSVLMTLTQLGIGPSTGFFISDDTALWSTFLEGRTDIEAVKTLVYLKVRLIFDPPSSSFVLDAMERQISEVQWRLNVQVEEPVVEEVVVDE